MEENRRQPDDLAGSSRDDSSANGLMMAMLAHRVPLTLLPDLAMAGRGPALEPDEPNAEQEVATAPVPVPSAVQSTPLSEAAARLAARAETHRRRTQAGPQPIVGTRPALSRRGRHAGDAAAEADEATQRPPSGRHRGRVGARHAKGEGRARARRAAAAVASIEASSAATG